MTNESTTLVFASFWRRVGARVCDYGILTAIQLVAMALVAVLDAKFGSKVKAGNFALLLVASVTPLIYFAVGNSSRFRSLGYRLAGLRLETEQGQPVSLVRNLSRFLLWWLAASVVCCGGILNFLWIFRDSKKRAGHDLACKTQVIVENHPRLVTMWTLSVATLLFFGLWIGRFWHPVPLQAFYLPSGSMEPTLRKNDRILVNLLPRRIQAPRNGEIAIFKAPEAALLNQNLGSDVDFIKRVVGVPGDVVEIVDRQLIRNGVKVPEPFCKWDAPTDDLLTGESPPPRSSYDLKIVGNTIYSREYLGPNQRGPWSRNGIIVAEQDQAKISRAKAGKVPPNQFVMLGDHRSNSNDSHVFGFVSRQAFEGRAMFIYWPLSRWKWLE